MSSLLLLSDLAFALSPAAPSRPNPKMLSDSEYWQQTDISFNNLKAIINDVVCFSSEQNFIGCVDAMNFLTNAANEKLTLVPYSPDHESKVVEKYGALAVVKETEAAAPATPSENSKKSNLEIWKEAKAKIEAETKAKAKAYPLSRLPGSWVSFDAILPSLWNAAQSSPSVKKEDINLLIASTLNIYLSSAVDPHTRLMPDQKFFDERNTTTEQFSGIGASLEDRGGKILIQTPFEGSPALKAGLRYQDVITHVDGTSVEKMSVDNVIKLIKGPAGTVVKLSINRKGNPLELSVTRGKIEIKNVTARMLDNPRAEAGYKMGYIRLRNFVDQESCTKMEEEIQNLQNQGAKGLILDLRGNPGGDLKMAICIGGLFLGDRVVVRVKDLSSETRDYSDYKDEDRSAPVTRLPMVTLIDAGSASASEIIAGALQDYKRSWISGDRSFGKGTVQSLDPITPSIRYAHTVQRFHQPSSRTNQVVGIIPDFPTLPKPGATEDEQFALREGDRYTNAVPQIGPAWEQTRPKSVAKMQACLSETAKADQRFQEQQDVSQTAPDYRLLAAEDILTCDLSLRQALWQ